MTRFSRTETITHDIGPDGRLSVRTVSGDVRVRAVDGTLAKVVARYDVQVRAEFVGEIPPDASPLIVRKGVGELEVDTRNRVGGFLDTLGEVIGRGSRTTVEYDVELPPGAALRLHGVSADLSIAGTRGAQEYHTVSGDISIQDAAGRINVRAVSGDVSITDGHELEIDGNSTSGDVQVQAESLSRFGFSSVSGDISVDSQLEPGDGYRVETVTGDLELVTPSGVEVEASGPSVAVRTGMPHRSDSGRGRKVITVGDGAARLRFRSMSGAVTVSAPFGTHIAHGVEDTVGERVENAAGLPFGDQPQQPWGGTWSDPIPGPGQPEEPADQMAVLRALECGEIDVTEATRLLSEAGPRG